MREHFKEEDLIIDSCIVTAYLCIYAMYTSIWDGHVIPSHCSSQLLRNLQNIGTSDDLGYKKALLTWMIYVGGSFAPYGVIRSEYAILVTGTHASQIESFAKSWSTLQACLRRFLWSEEFSQRCKAFWEETASF